MVERHRRKSNLFGVFPPLIYLHRNAIFPLFLFAPLGNLGLGESSKIIYHKFQWLDSVTH